MSLIPVTGKTLTVVLCLAATCASGLCAGEIKPDERFLWSCYMICFPINRDFKGFKDRPLNRPDAGGADSRLVDLQNAVAAGVDAFSVDLFVTDRHALPTFSRLAELIRENHLPIQLSPMFDGLQDPKVTVDDFVGKVKAWFERFADDPCVVRHEGKPVIFTFAAYDFSPEQWRLVFDRLKDAGCEGSWIAEMGRYLSLGTAPQFDPARSWLELFAGGNIFSARRPERTGELVRLYRRSYPAPFHQWVGSTAIGYWRPEIAVYDSPDGTRLFRDTWQAVVDNEIQWVQQATWNDFSENHQIMPSENHSTAFAELNRYLAARWKGREEKLNAPRFYLCQQQEVDVGEDALFELAAILRPEDVPVRAALCVRDGRDEMVKAFDPLEVTQWGLQAAEFRLPISNMPAGRLLVPEGRLLDAKGKTVLMIRGPYSIVYPGGYRPERNYSWLNTPAHRQVSEVRCELVLDGRATGAMAQIDTRGIISLRVDSPLPLVDVEVLHEGAQVISLKHDMPDVSLNPPATREGRLPLNRRGALDWGAYAVRAVTTDGRIATSLPVSVDRPPEADLTLGLWTFDEDVDADVLDSSPWLHDGRLGGRPRREPWRPMYVPDRWGGECLRFDGVDDRVLLEGAIVPPDGHTVEGWIRPHALENNKSKRQLLFAVAGGAVILNISSEGRLSATRRAGDQLVEVVDGDPIKLNQWQHVAVAYDGTTLKLYRDGVLVAQNRAPGEGRCGQVSIGYNSVTDASFYRGEIDEVRLSARALKPEEFGPHNPLNTFPK